MHVRYLAQSSVRVSLSWHGFRSVLRVQAHKLRGLHGCEVRLNLEAILTKKRTFNYQRKVGLMDDSWQFV